MKKALYAIELKNMPFDRCDGFNFVHATGREVIFDDGSSEVEYEDYEYDVPTTMWEDEEDD